MKAVVLCAGFGTRLGDWTRETPKPMLRLAGKPILGHILEFLSTRGIRQVAVNLHYHADQIRGHFGDGSGHGVELHYSYEESLLGTAGALGPLSAWLSDSPDFLVLYGDIVTDQDLEPILALHRREAPLATLLLHRRRKSNSVVVLDERSRITRFLERPSEEERARAGIDPEGAWVNSGIQVLNRRILDHIPAGAALDLPRDIYARVCGEVKICGYLLSGSRYAIDSQERFTEAGEALQMGTLKIRKGNGNDG